MFKRSRALACLVLAFASGQVWGGVHLQSFGIDPSDPGPQLFTTVGAQTSPGPGTSATAETAWPVTINYALMDTLPASVEVNFPDRAHAVLTKTLGEQRVGGWIWTGFGHGCFAVFSRFASVMRGTLSCGSAPYAIAHTPGTTAEFLTRHSGSGMTAAQEELPGAPPGTPPWSPQTSCSGPDATVDVLVLFSGDYAPLGASIWEDAQFAIDLVRGIMHNSQSTANIRLAGAARISRVGPGFPPVDLDDLPLDSQVLSLRNYWAGDVVIYLASGTAFQAAGVLGAANIPQNEGMPPPGPQFADLAFAALLGDYATDPGFYTFAHEFGHTFGANHARGDDSPNPDNPTPVEPWAFGRWAAMTRQQAQKNRYGAHDIMAYMNQCVAVVLNNDPDNCQMVPFYSNPAVTVTTEYLMDDGNPWTFTTGVAHNQPNPADNAAVINEFSSCSAQYRARTDRIFADPFE